MKCVIRRRRVRPYNVAPRAGAWIEIKRHFAVIVCLVCVAPRAGAWIEMLPPKQETRCRLVAPRAGAWIEI